MEQILYPLGKIVKTHGYKGSVVLVSDKPFDDDVEDLEEMFVKIDGLQVPFPVEALELFTDTSAIVQLEFVSSQNEALKLIGNETYSKIQRFKDSKIQLIEQWIGYVVNDSRYGKIGDIRTIENYNGNIVIQVINGNRETLISLNPEIINNIDHDAKIINITVPDGYF